MKLSYKKMMSTVALVAFATTAVVAVAPSTYAAETLQVNSVVIDLNGTQIVISTQEYGLYLLGLLPSLAEYISNQNGNPSVSSIRIGDKYVAIQEYGFNLLLSNGDTTKAAEDTPEIEPTGFQEFQGFDSTGQIILKEVIAAPVVVTLSDLKPTFIQSAPGVYAVKFALADAQATGANAGDTLTVKVPGKADLEFTYNATAKVFLNANIQGYTEAELQAATVTVK